MHYTTRCNTQSSAPEDGHDHSPKPVELIGIINKPLLLHLVGVCIIFSQRKGKGQSVPLQAWSDPESSGKLRFQDFMTTAQKVGKVVSLTHRPHLPPGNPPGTHFC